MTDSYLQLWCCITLFRNLVPFTRECPVAHSTSVVPATGPDSEGRPQALSALSLQDERTGGTAKMRRRAVPGPRPLYLQGLPVYQGRGRLRVGAEFGRHSSLSRRHSYGGLKVVYRLSGKGLTYAPAASSSNERRRCPRFVPRCFPCLRSGTSGWASTYNA